MTFSINIGKSTESGKYDIIGATSIDLSQIFNTLHDNIDKEIGPIDIRNSILTSWSNISFKETMASQSSISYIGIDTINPIDRDSKVKIYLGKRSFSGTYSYSDSDDIMTSSLLNSDVDIFLYNTKRDTVSNNRTRVSILSGTNSSLFNSSPYIQSQVVITSTQSLSLDIVNPTLTSDEDTSISFYSSYGTVSFNEITFPRPKESMGLDVGLTGAGDGRVLKWNDNMLSWGDISFNSASFIGITGSILNIYGSPINLNNHSLEFSDSRGCPISIGGINIGSTFNSISISEMLRRISYTYLPPICSISILPPYTLGYVEVGDSPLIKLSYIINKRTLPTNITSLSNMIPSFYKPITDPLFTMVSGIANGIVISPISNTSSSFTITVNDGTLGVGGVPKSNSATSTISGIYPYFYGFSQLLNMTTVGLYSLNKDISPFGDKDYDITGGGNLYFIYDNDYSYLSDIKDEFGNSIYGSFSSSILTLSSPIGIWASKKFKVYQWNGVLQIGPPSVNYQFEY